MDEKLPKSAQELLDAAVRSGWQTGMGHGVDSAGNPFIEIAVGRKQAESAWHYKITWHTRNTGTYRLFSKLARTPDISYWHDAPSLRRIHEIISAHPLTAEHDHGGES